MNTIQFIHCSLIGHRAIQYKHRQAWFPYASFHYYVLDVSNFEDNFCSQLSKVQYVVWSFNLITNYFSLIYGCIITRSNNACQVVTGIMLSNQCIVSVLLDVFRLDTNSPLSLSTTHQHKHPLSSYLENEGKRGRGGASNKQANNSQIFPKRERERNSRPKGSKIRGQ